MSKGCGLIELIMYCVVAGLVLGRFRDDLGRWAVDVGRFSVDFRSSEIFKMLNLWEITGFVRAIFDGAGVGVGEGVVAKRWWRCGMEVVAH